MIFILLLVGIPILAYLICAYLLKRNISTRRISFSSFQDLQGRLNDPLVHAERALRKTAFETVPMMKSEFFYSDADLDGSFDLIVVREKTTKTPLLSSRSYTDQSLILKQLQAHEPSDYLNLSLLPNEQYVFLDRLSSNSNHSFFIKMRQRVFMNYYIYVLKSYPNHNIILMARSSPDERLLTKYLRLGFHVVGKQKHNQTDHWILLLSGKNSTKGLSQSTVQFILFKLFT